MFSLIQTGKAAMIPACAVEMNAKNAATLITIRKTLPPQTLAQILESATDRYRAGSEGSGRPAGCRIFCSWRLQAGSEVLPAGLGARHTAAAAITANTAAVSVVVSQSTGVVSVFRNSKRILILEKSKK